jgi:hypothetical protein
MLYAEMMVISLAEQFTKPVEYCEQAQVTTHFAEKHYRSFGMLTEEITLVEIRDNPEGFANQILNSATDI